MKIFFALLFFLFTYASISQEKKNITLEDIWIKNTFKLPDFAGFKWLGSGRDYMKLEQTEQSGYFIGTYDILTSKKLNTIVNSSNLIASGDSIPISIDDYELSQDQNKIIIKTETESIYRYSSRSVFYIYIISTKELSPLAAKQKISYATFSPDGTKIAYVNQNNLYYTDLITGKEIAITNTGKRNEIINGASDWVYEEEFELIQAFSWSPDSKKIAWHIFDESQVKEYSMQIWKDLYPTNYTFKYPKAGEKNSYVSIASYDLQNQTTSIILDGNEKDQYVPRIYWTADSKTISIQLLNRNQDSLQVIHANYFTGKKKLIKTFSSNAYVEINKNTHYLKSKTWICTSEETGYRHIYIFDEDGNQVRQVTAGNWEVTEIKGVDETNKKIYFTSKEVSPMEEHLYVIDFEGKNKRRLTFGEGVNEVALDPSFTYFVNYNSNLKTALTIALCRTSDGKVIKELQNSKALIKKTIEFDFGTVEFGTFKNREGVNLNSWILKPSNFDSTKKYPILLFVYGGVGQQTVTKEWRGKNQIWFQLLVQQGYIIASLDNRGTGGRGTVFKNCTNPVLGKLESQDQIEYAKFLGSKSFIDKMRIGIFGWSYGGYLSSLCLLLGSDIFKTAIAVAPVTSWRFYDSIYSERFLKNPRNNPKGYDDYCPITHVEKLKGNYLIIHGTADDNVHFQNTVEMQNALINAGKQFDSFFYPNKSHGISGGTTRLHLYQLMTDFLLKKL